MMNTGDINVQNCQTLIEQFNNRVSMSDCSLCSLSSSRSRITKARYRISDPSRIVMMVAEAPGQNEDEQGFVLVGKAGTKFQAELNKFGLRNYYLTNICRCWPGKGNRKPTLEEMGCCGNKWLSEEISLIDPVIIVAMGGTASEYLIGKKISVTKESNMGIWHGVGGRSVYVSQHPSFLFNYPFGEKFYVHFIKMLETVVEFQKRR